jgi:hypothetical protein
MIIEQKQTKTLRFQNEDMNTATKCGCSPLVSQPHFEGSVRSPFTLPKMGLGSPLGLPKTQNSIVGVKTPCIEVFFIMLERSQIVDV